MDVHHENGIDAIPDISYLMKHAGTLYFSGLGICIGCFVLCSIITVVTIRRQMKLQLRVKERRMIIVILLLVPIVSSASLLSVLFLRAKTFLHFIILIYEGWVLYVFIRLAVHDLKGSALAASSISQHEDRNWWYIGPFMLCSRCSSPRPFTEKMVRTTSYMVLQTTVIRPVLVAVSIILYFNGNYIPDNMSPDNSFMYIHLLVLFPSMFLAFYGLTVFCKAANLVMPPESHQWTKYLGLRAAIMVPNIQALILNLLVKFNVIKGNEVLDAHVCAGMYYDALITFESVLLALCFIYSYSNGTPRDQIRKPLLNINYDESD